MAFFEIARNSSGLLAGPNPFHDEAQARAHAAKMAVEQGESFQLWDDKRLIDVISPP